MQNIQFVEGDDKEGGSQVNQTKFFKKKKKLTLTFGDNFFFFFWSIFKSKMQSLSLLLKPPSLVPPHIYIIYIYIKTKFNLIWE